MAYATGDGVMTRPTIASVHTDVEVIKAQLVARDKADAERDILLKQMNEKLTSLVSLKDQGRGAAWLFGIIWVSGIIGGIGALWQWLVK